MKYLRIKRRRDIRRQRWQFLAVFVTITLGVMLFAASYDAYLNLESSYSGTYDRLAFADMTVTGADDTFPETAAQIEGVAVVESRHVGDTLFRIGGDVLQGRVVGMPPDSQPEVNRIDVKDGDYLDSSRPLGIVVEQHLADEMSVAVGDTVGVLAGGDWIDTEVVGIAVSAEYLWPAESRQNFFPPPGTFGVSFVAEDLLAPLPASAVAQQTVLRYDDGADRSATDAAVEQAAVGAGAADIMPQAEQPSNAGLKLDLQGFEELAVMFPILFLAAAGMATFTILTRIVYAQRSQIGTLMASGISRRMLTRHYLSYGLELGLIGAVVGVLLGMLMGWGMTGLYTQSLGIPDTVRELHWITPVVGLGFGLAVGLLSAWVPTRAASRTNPAEAMRGEVPTADGRASWLERVIPALSNLPVRWLMVLRGFARNRRRSVSTIIGVVLALTLILASWGMIDTVVNLLDRNFNEIAVEDLTVLYRVPVGEAQVQEVMDVPGIAHAEGVVGLTVSARGPDGSYGTQLEAYRAGTQVHGFPGGELPADGILAGRGLGNQIGVTEGDVVELSFPTLDLSFDSTVAGFVDEPMGTLVYMDRAALEVAMANADPAIPVEVLDEPSVTHVKAILANEASRDAAATQIEGMSDVAAVVDSKALYDIFQQFLGFFYVFVGVMLAFGAVMAFALIFNTISVNVAEREGEYATMRANGVSQRRVANLITGENLLLTVFGIIPGLVVGYFIATLFMKSYSSDMFAFELDMNTTTLVFSALAMIGVALISVWPAIRTVRRLDIATVVRERSA